MTNQERERVLEAVCDAALDCESLRELPPSVRVEAANRIRRDVARRITPPMAVAAVSQSDPRQP